MKHTQTEWAPGDGDYIAWLKQAIAQAAKFVEVPEFEFIRTLEVLSSDTFDSIAQAAGVAPAPKCGARVPRTLAGATSQKNERQDYTRRSAKSG